MLMIITMIIINAKAKMQRSLPVLDSVIGSRCKNQAPGAIFARGLWHPNVTDGGVGAVMMRHLCLEQFSAGKRVGGGVVRSIVRQVITSPRIGKSYRHSRNARAPALIPWPLVVPMQTRFQLHGINDRKLDVLTQAREQRMLEKITLYTAVMHHPDVPLEHLKHVCEHLL